MEHVIIPPLSELWYKGLIGSILIITIITYLLKKSSEKFQNNFMRLMSVVFAIAWFYAIIYEVSIDIWSVKDSLPLHLCRVSFIICIINFWKPKQWMFEWCVFLAIPAAAHAMFTPELTMGKSNWLLFYYYFTHAAMLFVPIFLSVVKKMKPRVNGWKNAFWYLQILVVINLPLNFLINSNYMYLHHKPGVDNPFLIGDWPWYILVLEFVFFLHLLLIKYIFPPKKKLEEIKI